MGGEGPDIFRTWLGTSQKAQGSTPVVWGVCWSPRGLGSGKLPPRSSGLPCPGFVGFATSQKASGGLSSREERGRLGQVCGRWATQKKVNRLALDRTPYPPTLWVPWNFPLKRSAPCASSSRNTRFTERSKPEPSSSFLWSGTFIRSGILCPWSRPSKE